MDDGGEGMEVGDSFYDQRLGGICRGKVQGVVTESLGVLVCEGDNVGCGGRRAGGAEDLCAMRKESSDYC